ncbi:MAG: EAL domain-containing protein [Rhodocyclaceae bacterium]|nr:EAL domain-containing protein [Rhodocyclaceae bacterium]
MRKRIVGVEALVRWQHPEHWPARSLRLHRSAEETILHQGDHRFRARPGLRLNSRSGPRGHSELRMSVNASPQEFDRGDLVDRITSHVERHRLPPNSWKS